MKVDAYPVLRTVLFSLQNGKGLSQAIKILKDNAKERKHKQTYSQIGQYLVEGNSLASALKRYCRCSDDVVYFVYVAQQSTNFASALGKVVGYLEIKDAFQEESSEKVTLPMIYFFLAVIVVFVIKFFALPYQFERAQQYSAEVLALIENHLLFAKHLSDVLIVLLALLAFYFFMTLAAVFSNTRTTQKAAKAVVTKLPFARRIVLCFDKFIVFTMLSQMLLSGLGIKQALQAALHTQSSKTFTDSFSVMLETMRTQGKMEYPEAVFDGVEKGLLQGVGSNAQLGVTFEQIGQKSKLEAMNLSKRFFRYITIAAILLMAFAVFIEFYVVVLTQLLLQKGLVNLGNSGGAF